MSKHESINAVQVDGLVLLKIVKHCRESLPSLVTGLLLGMDVGKTLEITNCFPFPKSEEAEKTADGTPAEDESTKYQINMMTCLRDLNVDTNTVGWYTSTYMESYFDSNLIKYQYQYQKEFGKRCVCVVFDPLRTTQGNFYLKAFRLTDAFIKMFENKTGGFTQENLAKYGLKFKDVVEEVPITLHNTAIASAFLQQLDDGFSFNADPERLDISVNDYLEKNVGALIESVDEFHQEQNKYQYQLKKYNAILKRRQEGDALEDDKTSIPTKLESLLTSNQISNYCDQIQKFSGQSMLKVNLLEALHKERTTE